MADKNIIKNCTIECNGSHGINPNEKIFIKKIPALEVTRIVNILELKNKSKENILSDIKKEMLEHIKIHYGETIEIEELPARIFDSENYKLSSFEQEIHTAIPGMEISKTSLDHHKNKEIQFLHSCAEYQNCTFNIDNVFDVQDCNFFNCSFRKNIIIKNIENCRFNNCNFLDVRIEKQKEIVFEDGYINTLNIVCDFERDIWQIMDLVKISNLEVATTKSRYIYNCFLKDKIDVEELYNHAQKIADYILEKDRHIAIVCEIDISSIQLLDRALHTLGMQKYRNRDGVYQLENGVSVECLSFGLYGYKKEDFENKKVFVT